jgi:hypothetical protein
MEEVMVALACLMHKGCTETSQAYYASKPELVELVKVKEKKIKENMPPIVVQYVAPTALVAFFPKQANITIRLTRDFSLTYRVDRTTLNYSWTFK